MLFTHTQLFLCHVVMCPLSWTFDSEVCFILFAFNHLPLFTIIYLNYAIMPFETQLVCVCVCECEHCSLEVLIKVTADCLYDWDLEWRGLQWLDLWGKTLTLLSVEGCGSNGVGVSMKWTVFVCVCVSGSLGSSVTVSRGMQPAVSDGNG